MFSRSVEGLFSVSAMLVLNDLYWGAERTFHLTCSQLNGAQRLLAGSESKYCRGYERLWRQVFSRICEKAAELRHSRREFCDPSGLCGPLWTVWCGREDSNFHGLSPTTTSTLRVYQFRHDRT